MRPQDTAYIIERLAVRFMAMVADHERQLAEHRASFGARTEADAKVIAGMRAERDGLLTQVQDMRAEIESLARECKAWELSTSEAWTNATANMLSVVFPEGRNIPENTALTNYQLFRTSMVDVAEEISRLHTERDGLRAEVAALQERLRASIARGDFAQMEVAALKSQTPKHPVKVGEYVKNDNGDVCQVHEVYAEYLLNTGWTWAFENCAPCDPPEATHITPDGKATAQAAVTPQPGDVVRLVRVPTQKEYPDWQEDFGVAGSTGCVVSLSNDCINVKYNGDTWEWPLSCVEVVKGEDK